jgi:MFS transporter, DHA2 family, multidrug resistance protein
VALGGFSVISFVLAGVHDFSWEIALRFVQGLFLGAVYVPAAVLMLTSIPVSMVPIAPPFFATVVLGGGLLGHLIGGYVGDNFGGNAVYLPSAVVTLIAAAFIYLAVPNVDAPQRRLRPGLVGYALSLMAFGAMEYFANEGERRNWFDDQSIVIAFAVLVLSAPVFVLFELGASRPHVNFPLFAQKRNLAVGAAVNVVLGLAGYSVVTFVVYLETQIQATETLAGEMIAMRLGTYAVGITVAFCLTKLRLLSVRAMVCIAAFGSALAFVAYGRTMTTTAEAGSFIVISLLFGLFFSMLSQPVPALVLGTLGPADLPAGLSMYKISSPLGLTIGTGMFQTFFDHRDTLHLTELAGSITPAYTPIALYLKHGGSLRTLAATVDAQAQSLAFHDVMVCFAVVVLLAVPVIFLADIGAGTLRNAARERSRRR